MAFDPITLSGFEKMTTRFGELHTELATAFPVILKDRNLQGQQRNRPPYYRVTTDGAALLITQH